MIKLQYLKEKSKELENFEKIQWRLSDIEHFGRESWKAKKFIFTALENNNIAGFVEFEIAAGVCHVESLLIAKDKKRQGIGKTLMEKAEAVARKFKVHQIFLSTGKNWGSAKFYESLGYKVAATFPDHYGHQDFVQYSKFLS